MATATGKACCVICGKGKATLRCGGCSQDFCYNHVADHRQELNRQLDEIEVNRDVFRQTLTDQSTHPQKHDLIKQIDQWERESIKIIRQTAEDARHLVLEQTIERITQIEDSLSTLTDELRQSRQENDFFETDLSQWKEELKRLTKELAKPSNIKLGQDSVPLVNKIYVNIIPKTLRSINIGTNTRWSQNAVTVAGGNGKGGELNQLCGPFGIYVDNDRTIYVADYGNHRILEWKCGATSGQVVAGGNGVGNRVDQLNCPTNLIIDEENEYIIICDRDNRRVIQWRRRNGQSGKIIIADIDCWGLTMDNKGYLYVSNCDKHEVRRWRIGEVNGTVVAGGNGKGDHLNQLNYPTYLFVDHEYSVYVSEMENHRVTKWIKGAKEGIVVVGGKGQGSGLAQLSTPRGVRVDELGNVYVVDDYNHRVMRWSKGAKQGTVVIGGNEQGDQPNELDGPTGLTFDQQGNLYVVDWGNNRVQRYNTDASSNA